MFRKSLTARLRRSEREKMPEVVILRWGHRPQRDARLTTHVALVARALGAGGMVLSDIKDSNIKLSVEKVSRDWGGSFFLDMGIPWKKTVREWRNKGGIVVHLTAYGENIQKSDVLSRIKDSGKDVLVIVGSQKVPGQFFSEEVADFNVAIGNQPHSECASLAVFLDRFFKGEELVKDFENAKVQIIPQHRGKRTNNRKQRDS